MTAPKSVRELSDSELDHQIDTALVSIRALPRGSLARGVAITDLATLFLEQLRRARFMVQSNGNQNQ